MKAFLGKQSNVNNRKPQQSIINGKLTQLLLQIRFVTRIVYNVPALPQYNGNGL